MIVRKPAILVQQLTDKYLIDVQECDLNKSIKLVKCPRLYPNVSRISRSLLCIGPDLCRCSEVV